MKMMKQALIDQLLFEAEGDMLDFKSDQYRFSGATDEDKSELLKDIIAFANAWRRADAYILIGVKEIRGGRNQVMGISNHLDDANLQQFINSKTQMPIEFSYKTVQYEGVQMGIIHIPLQRKRPFYLQRDFGRLKKETVYIRRGSSTDIASIEEISTMGTENVIHRDTPSLEAFLVVDQHDESLEKQTYRKLYNIKILDDELFPDYGDEDPSFIRIGSRPNRDYYREYAKYFQTRFRVRGFKISIKNAGTILARDVKVILDIANEEETSIACGSVELPSKPRPEFYDISLPPRPNSTREVPDVLVKRAPHSWRITCHLGKIQPKDMATTRDYFYLGATTSKSIQINTKIFSDELPEPKQETLEVSFEVEDIMMDFQKLEYWIYKFNNNS